MKNYTLVVMAAGMGSRFGGLKQITPVDNDGNFIIDYSVFDAKKAGFNKVVFVIKEENLSLFEETIGNRIKDEIEVCYAFQKMTDIPRALDLSTREKPWGTVQAILSASKFVNEPFAVINADDFYGYDAYHQAVKFFDENQTPHHYACISYPFDVTKSSEGAVKRGVLILDEKGNITNMIESSIDESYVAHPLNGSEPFAIEPDASVSMNFFAFQKDAMDLLEEYWLKFFEQSDEEILKKEALLPDCLAINLKNDVIQIHNCPSNGIWLGMTYRSDLEMVKNKLTELKEKNEYPEHLWDQEMTLQKLK